MFLLAVMGFFIFVISGVQLISGGYLLVGIPALIISGMVPIISSFWGSQQSYSDYDYGGSSNDGCCGEVAGCGCGPCWYVK